MAPYMAPFPRVPLRLELPRQAFVHRKTVLIYKMHVRTTHPGERISKASYVAPQETVVDWFRMRVLMQSFRWKTWRKEGISRPKKKATRRLPYIPNSSNMSLKCLGSRFDFLNPSSTFLIRSSLQGSRSVHSPLSTFCRTIVAGYILGSR